jgi:hypothetical protein
MAARSEESVTTNLVAPPEAGPAQELCLEAMNREELEGLGRILDQRPASLRGRTVAMALAETLLLVRTREGRPAHLRANAAQRAFERRRGQRNIVLKARQMGMTTWAAARFFLKTITRPGTLTLQVAHSQESAEEIFRIIHRFLDWLPEQLREGPLRTSRANVRQIVFPEIDAQYRVVSAGDRNAGRGLTVQNLHCSELARWPGNPGDILAGLQAALTPGAELILESTPDGVGGCFHEEWQKAAETGTVRHFFPWWMEPRYRAEAVEEASLTGEERDLIARHRLDLKQIGYRRRIRANFRGLARQEYAESEESCFLASGDSVFELAAIEARLEQVPEPNQSRRNGELSDLAAAPEGQALSGCGGPRRRRQRGRLLGCPGARIGDRDAVRRVCRTRWRPGTRQAHYRAGARVQRCMAGDRAQQSRQRCAGAGRDCLPV